MRPEFVSEDDDVIFAVDAFRQEVALHEEGAAHHFVETGSDLPAAEVFGLVFRGDVEGA